MKEKDDRVNLKVSPQARRLVNLLAAHHNLSQSEVIEKLAEKECQLAGLPIKENVTPKT